MSGQVAQPPLVLGQRRATGWGAAALDAQGPQQVADRVRGEDIDAFGRAEAFGVEPLGDLREGGAAVGEFTGPGGKIYTPLGGWYHATKFALEALSDCLRLEVKPFGINVVVIEPGGIQTEWPGIAADKLKKASSGGPYAKQADAVAASLTSDATARRSSPPTLIAGTIAKAVITSRPRTRYATGYGARPIIFLHNVLPDRAFETFIRRATGVPS